MMQESNIKKRVSNSIGCSTVLMFALYCIVFPSDSLTEDGRGAGGDQGVQQVWGGHCGEGYEGEYVRISVYLIIYLQLRSMLELAVPLWHPPKINLNKI